MKTLIHKDEAKKSFLALPFNDDQFRDFIEGLLGSPQTISKGIRGTFTVELEDLKNFHNLIDQRITQQNKGKLIQLKTKIYYSDDSSVLLGSYDELVTYNECKPLISNAVRMTWSYLIQFADKNIPEKQEIELMIIATPQDNMIEDDDITVFFPNYGKFVITIKHTARTWGTDMEGLITNKINSLLNPCSKFKEFIRKKNFQIGVSAGLLFLITSIVSIFLYTKSFNKNELENVMSFINSGFLIDEKINFILTYIAQNSQNIFFLKSLFFILVSTIIAIMIGTWIGMLADIKTKSFLLLTTASTKNREQQIKKDERKVIYFFVSIIVSIVTSVIANFIFGWIIKL